jgi:hypothetical protein
VHYTNYNYYNRNSYNWDIDYSHTLSIPISRFRIETYLAETYLLEAGCVGHNRKDGRNPQSPGAYSFGGVRLVLLLVVRKALILGHFFDELSRTSISRDQVLRLAENSRNSIGVTIQ